MEHLHTKYNKLDRDIYIYIQGSDVGTVEVGKLNYYIL